MRFLMSVIDLFPKDMRKNLLDEIELLGTVPEEIRLRNGAPICLRAYGREHLCCKPIKKEQLIWVVGNAAEGSFHTAERYLRMGYLPLRYGSRMGVCGNGINGKLSSLGDVSSVCIRIARSAEGCGERLYNQLYREGFCNTIIIAPPGAGKTTLLRELIRMLTYSGLYVGVVDERGEIAGMYRDKPSFDLGPRSDVLSGIPKNQGAMMLLRSMTPNVIAMDEITGNSDSDVVVEAAECGAGLLTTVHGEDVTVLRKPGFQRIMEMGVFQAAVLIEVSEGKRRYKVVDLNDEIVRRNCYSNRRRNVGGIAITGNVRTDTYIGYAD